MKKIFLSLSLAAALLIPATSSAQVYSQYQLIIPPFGNGVLISTSTANGGKIQASSSPNLASIYATSTTATSSISHLSATQFSLGSLTGFLKTVSGYVTTALVDLASNVTGILSVANGGTGTSTQVTNGVNFYDGSKITSGTALSWTSGSLVVNQGNRTNAYALDLTNLGPGTNGLLLDSAQGGSLSIAHPSGTSWEIGSINRSLLISSNNNAYDATGYGVTLTSINAPSRVVTRIYPQGSSQTADILQVQDLNSAVKLNVAAGGNVGIGTSSPFSLLSVVGNTYLGGTLTATGTVAFQATTTGTYFSSDFGAVGSPTYTFTGDTDTGLYHNNTNIVGLSGGGAAVSWDGTRFYPNSDNVRNLGGSTNRWLDYWGSGTATTSSLYVSGLTSSLPSTDSLGKLTATTVSSPLLFSGNTLSIQAADTTHNGYLSSTDWSTFNGKQGALTLTTTGSSGAATLVGNTLNVPQYAGSTYTGTWPITVSGSTISWSGLATSTNISAGQALYATGANTFAGVATSSVANGTGISFTGTPGALLGGTSLTITNTGLLSLAQTYGTAQTGAITLATTSNTTNGITSKLSITNTGGAFTLSSDQTGTLTVAGGGTGVATLTGIAKGNGTGAFTAAANGTDYTLITAKTCTSGDFVSSVTAAGVFTCTTPSAGTGTVTNIATTYPLLGGPITNTGTLSLAFGTTTANSWSQLQTFSGGTTATNNSLSVPGYAFTDEAGYGIGHYTGNLIFFAGGVLSTVISPSLFNYRLPSGWEFSWSSATDNLSGSDTGISRLGAASLAVGNGTAGDSSGKLTAANITIGTLSGVLKAASGVVSTATNGTDYTLTTAQSCTNQVITALTAAGGSTCSTVSNAMLANSTISGIALGANLANLTATDSTLTFSGAYNGGTARTIGLNLGNANIWIALQQFSNASTSLASFTGVSYFGGIATSTLNADGMGSLSLASGILTVSTTTATSTFAGGLQIATAKFTGLVEFFGNVIAKVGATLDFSNATVKEHVYPAFSYATSTAWTGTTTVPLGVAYTLETWKGVKCFTDVGTVNVSFNDGTNRMDMFNASTTIGTIGLTTNNALSAGTKRYVDVGTPATSPTKISCTVDKIVNQ